MAAKAVKKAKLIFPDKREDNLVLLQVEPKVLRWETDGGREWDGVDYLDEATAIASIRVLVERDPAYVGVDLTVLSMDPTPAERAAGVIGFEFGMTEVPRVAEIIAKETNIDGLTEHISTLIAYLFRHRPAFAKALFPVTEAGAPRDMVLDGLLLNVIQAMEKSTGQTFGNLTKILLEPVSVIQMASKLPPGGGKIQ
jgi:hypothetical protein